MKPFDRIHKKIKNKGRSDIEDKLDGFSRIGWGFDRTVYEITTDKYGAEYKGKVIKFGSSGKNARTANKKELETWMVLKDDKNLGRHFCPIRDRGKNFRWIIMDYAEPVNSLLKRFKSRRKQKKFRKILGDVDEYLDFKHENMGYHKDRGVVFIDYPWGGDFITEKRERTLTKLMKKMENAF